MVISHAQKSYQIVTINDRKWASLYIQKVYVYLIEERTGLQETDQKMSVKITKSERVILDEIAKRFGADAAESQEQLILSIKKARKSIKAGA